MEIAVRRGKAGWCGARQGLAGRGAARRGRARLGKDKMRDAITVGLCCVLPWLLWCGMVLLSVALWAKYRRLDESY